MAEPPPLATTDAIDKAMCTLSFHGIELMTKEEINAHFVCVGYIPKDDEDEAPLANPEPLFTDFCDQIVARSRRQALETRNVTADMTIGKHDVLITRRAPDLKK